MNFWLWAFGLAWLSCGFVCSAPYLFLHWWKGGSVAVQDLVVLAVITVFGPLWWLLVAFDWLAENRNGVVIAGRRTTPERKAK